MNEGILVMTSINDKFKITFTLMEDDSELMNLPKNLHSDIVVVANFFQKLLVSNVSIKLNNIISKVILVIFCNIDYQWNWQIPCAI